MSGCRPRGSSSRLMGHNGQRQNRTSAVGGRGVGVDVVDVVDVSDVDVVDVVDVDVVDVSVSMLPSPHKQLMVSEYCCTCIR